MSIHNFLNSFLTPTLASFTIQQLQGDPELLFDIAVQHFVDGEDYLQFLVEALHAVLDLQKNNF